MIYTYNLLKILLRSQITTVWDGRNLLEQVKKALPPKIVLTFHCLNKLFLWSQKFCKLSAFNIEFQKFFWSLEQFFLTISHNNFGNKIPFKWGSSKIDRRLILCQSKPKTYLVFFEIAKTNKGFYFFLEARDPNHFTLKVLIDFCRCRVKS